MPVCSVIGCGIRKTPNQPSLTMHRIPRNEHKRKKWLEAIGLENIKPNVKDIYICSLHFDDKCFNKTLDVTRLRDDAVPFKLPCKKAATTVTTPAHGTLDVEIPILPLKTGLALDPAPAPISGTSRAATSALPMTTTAACTASFTSVPGTSGVDNLPNQARIKKLENKCDFLRKKVKQLNEKVRRQKKKIAKFQNIIKDLKERKLVNNKNSIYIIYI